MAMHSNITAYVDFSSLESYIKQLETLKSEYTSAYETDLYTNALNEIKDAYSGADSVAFTNKIEEFRDDFIKMSDVLVQYIEHLKKVLLDYRNTQNSLEQQARALRGERS